MIFIGILIAGLFAGNAIQYGHRVELCKNEKVKTESCLRILKIQKYAQKKAIDKVIQKRGKKWN